MGRRVPRQSLKARTERYREVVGVVLDSDGHRHSRVGNCPVRRRYWGGDFRTRNRPNA
jgi:hypothetical protein